LHQRRGGGEVDDRLVEIRQPGRGRRQMAVGVRHVARAFRVAALVGVEQTVPVEVPAERDRREEEEGPQARVRPAGQRRRAQCNCGPPAGCAGSWDTVTGTAAFRAPSTVISKRYGPACGNGTSKTRIDRKSTSLNSSHV